MEYSETISSKGDQQINMEIRETNIQITKRKFQAWTKKEDNQLMELYEKFPKKWAKISSLMEDRNQNQCLHRSLRLIKSDRYCKIWSTIEDELALKLIKEYGKNWKIISEKMGTKNGKQIKQRFLEKLDHQIQIKIKEESSIRQDNQQLFGNRLSGKKGKQYRNRLNYLQHIYSSQKTLPESIISAQFQSKQYKESAIANTCQSQYVKIEYKQSQTLICNSEIQYTSSVNRLKYNRDEPNFNEMNSLISTNSLKIQSNQEMNESDSCMFFQNQI